MPKVTIGDFEQKRFQGKAGKVEKQIENQIGLLYFLKTGRVPGRNPYIRDEFIPKTPYILRIPGDPPRTMNLREEITGVHQVQSTAPYLSMKIDYRQPLSFILHEVEKLTSNSKGLAKWNKDVPMSYNPRLRSADSIFCYLVRQAGGRCDVCKRPVISLGWKPYPPGRRFHFCKQGKEHHKGINYEGWKFPEIAEFLYGSNEQKTVNRVKTNFYSLFKIIHGRDYSRKTAKQQRSKQKEQEIIRLNQLRGEGKISEQAYNKRFREEFDKLMPTELDRSGSQFDEEYVTGPHPRGRRIPKKSQES